MTIEKVATDFFSGLRQQSDQNFKLDRLRRLISGVRDDIDRNPKNFIPQLPDEIRNKFTQDDSTSSNGSVLNSSSKSTKSDQHKSNRSKRRSSILNKIEENDENNSSQQASRSKYKLKSTIINSSDDDSQVINSMSTRRILDDNTNQAEKSRREPVRLEKTEILSNGLVVPEHENSKLNINNTKTLFNKQLNSTAILSDNKRSNKTFIPITPIPTSKTRDDYIIDHKSIISSDEDLDEVDNRSVVSKKNIENSKPNLILSNITDNNKNEANTDKTTTKLDFPSRKSLNFQERSKLGNVLFNRADKSSNKSDSDSDKTITKSTVAVNNNTKNKNTTKTIKETTNKAQTKSLVKDQTEYDNFDDDDDDEPIAVRSKNKTASFQQMSQSSNKSKPREKESSKLSSRNMTNKKTEDDSNIETSDQESEAEIVETKPSRSNTITNNQKNKTKSIIETSLDNRKSSQIREVSHRQSDLVETTSFKSKNKTESLIELRSDVRANNQTRDVSNLEHNTNGTVSDNSDTIRKQKNKTKSIIESSPESQTNNLTKKVSQSNNINETSSAKINQPATTSKITIQKLPKKSVEKTNDTTTDQRTDHNVKTPSPNDSLKNVINDLQSTLAKKAVNKNLEKFKTPNTENTSLNASESELASNNNQIFLKRSLARSVNMTGSTTINTTTNKPNTYVKKTIDELKTPLLANPKPTKTSFLVPQPPIPPKLSQTSKLAAQPPQPRSPIKLSSSESLKPKSSKESSSTKSPAKNSTINEQMVQMGFSNIEPVDMFSPSSTISVDEPEEVNDLEKNDSLIKKSNKNIKETNSKETAIKKPLLLIKPAKSKKTDKENDKKLIQTKLLHKNGKPLQTISTNITSTQSSSSSSTSASSSPKAKRGRKPIKSTQEREKNFRVRRKTILPVEVDNHDDEDNNGLRRSKRVKIDANKIPVYEYETITDFSGRKIVVEHIVGVTKRTCTFNDYYQEMHDKNSKVTVAKTKTVSKSRVVRPKRDLSESSSDSDNDSTLKEIKSQKVKQSKSEPKKARNSLETSAVETSNESNNSQNSSNNDNYNQFEQNHENFDNSKVSSSQPILIRKNFNPDVTEQSIVLETNETNANISQESIIFQDGDSSNRVKKHVINFHRNIQSYDFTEVYDGVSLKAFTENNGYICIEPNSTTRTQTHQNECEYTVANGNCLFSLNGMVTKLENHDIMHIPNEVPYKIKNTSMTKKAYIYFRFFQS